MGGQSIAHRRGPRQRLLLFALLLAPLTALRMGPIGAAELVVLLLLLLAGVHGTARTDLRSMPLSRFWASYLALVTWAWYVGFGFVDGWSSEPESALFDYAAYWLVFAACFVYERTLSRRSGAAESLIRDGILWGAVLFGALYLLSLAWEGTESLPLTSGANFSPLADNLHQTAMFLLPFPFLALHVRASTRGRLERLVLLVVSICFSWIIWETGSAKALLGLALGWLCIPAHVLWRTLPRTLFGVVSGLAALGAAAFVVTSETVSLLWTYFQFLDTNSERQTLYTDGLRMGVESALFGRGPGKHVMLRGELDDAHQTLLTILLQGGVLALLAFLSLVVRTVSEVLDRPYLLAAIVSLAMYVLGGDVLRRMPFWVQLALILGAARESVDSGSPDRSSRPVTSGGQAHAVSY